MADPTLVCPHCKADIHLTESLAAPLLESARAQFVQQLAEKDEQILAREAAILTKEKSLRESQKHIDTTVAEKIKIERAQIIAEEAQKAKALMGLELDEEKKKAQVVGELLKDREAKLIEAQKSQADFLKKQRELDDQKRELELTIEKRIQASQAEIHERAKKEVEDKEKLKQLEKDQKIDSLVKQIEILKQKAEQGSQQMQGEVLELELEMLLRQGFPSDAIEPVPKGEFGGDIVHRVVGQTGQSCGTILWEFKRTKNWSDGWLTKLRGDQRAAKAELCILVSQALPKGIDVFGHVEGVWVVSPAVVVPIATVLRHSLLQLNAARQSSEGQQTKTELVYQYLTGPQFRQRVDAIVEAFTSMQEDLNKERQAIMKQWSKREKQIENVMAATIGMWGDLQGISGKSLAEIEGVGFFEELEATEAVAPTVLTPQVITDKTTVTQTALPGL